MMTSQFVAATCLGAACLCGIAIQPVQKEVHPPTKPAGLNAHETHAAASMLGQFRTSIASWLWLRTDLYLHNGVEMRPMTAAEHHQNDRAASSTDDLAEAMHEDEKTTTVIPSAEYDFRGFFGDLDRATKAYKDMRNHSHNDPKSALPLFRLMTWSDPQFIQGWLVGAHVIGSQRKTAGARDKSLAFLREGITHNPESVALYSMLGINIFKFNRDSSTSIVNLNKAIDLGETIPRQMLTEDDQDGLRDAYRWLSLLHRDRGDLIEAATTAQRGWSQFDDDVVLFRLAHRIPRVYTYGNYKKIESHLMQKYMPVASQANPSPGEHHHDHDHEEVVDDAEMNMEALE